MKTDDTEAPGRYRAKPRRIIKRDPVDRSVITACTMVHHYNGAQYGSTETVLLV